jgi:hypothetical protein
MFYLQDRLVGPIANLRGGEVSAWGTGGVMADRWKITLHICSTKILNIFSWNFFI